MTIKPGHMYRDNQGKTWHIICKRILGSIVDFPAIAHRTLEKAYFFPDGWDTTKQHKLTHQYLSCYQ